MSIQCPKCKCPTMVFAGKVKDETMGVLYVYLCERCGFRTINKKKMKEAGDFGYCVQNGGTTSNNPNRRRLTQKTNSNEKTVTLPELLKRIEKIEKFLERKIINGELTGEVFDEDEQEELDPEYLGLGNEDDYFDENNDVDWENEEDDPGLYLDPDDDYD